MLSVGDLRLLLDGVSVRLPVPSGEVELRVDGFGLEYENDALRVTGAFLRSTRNGHEEYAGMAALQLGRKGQTVGLGAIGAYAYVDGQPSLFLYATLSYPLGGPPFFFVTGLSAGFGYNRSLTAPPLDEVASFPLVAQAVDGSGDPSTDNPGEVRVALELFNWKRQTAHQEHGLRQRSVRRLPRGRQRAEVSSAKPQGVAAWFQGLSRLVGLPFSYLVPEERLLPAESLRFFWLDPVWVDCLTDGALSVGRVTEADVVHDRRLRARMALRQSGPGVTGFLMRSSVVSGWPDLLVEGYPERVDDAGFIPERGDTLQLLRFDRIADDVLLCLFEGEIKTLDVHQKPEAMHFGLDARDNAADPYSKNLRTRDGTGEEELLIERVPWSDEGKGMLDIPALAAQMKEKLGWASFTAAQFALQMIEGVQKVRFLSEP
ncbi:DUF6603 domain-containing protein [Sorangium sp. So ce1097]|uniref:DUF6603 domain-containing protein n=1 Tax=Sorangium sp. So ce1097 TaxID=3133330 RepID=UPI003F5EE18C